MGDIVDVDFRSRIKRSPETDEASLKADFLNWLARSPDYQALRKFAVSVDTKNVITAVAKITSNPEESPTSVLFRNLVSKKVNEQTAPEMLAVIRVLRERFGIK